MPQETKPLAVVVGEDLPVFTGYFLMGAATAPDGRTLTVDSRCLRLNGKPWLPVAGEFHYARFPETEWREELLKMQAGGINIVASYIFWIHHEEQEGVFDWTGRRDLARFVRLCAELGLMFIARIGPWGHGEVRNGGHPDWLLAKGTEPGRELRSDDPVYLDSTRRFFEQIGAQLHGLLWKDGGPVVAVQCENEYGGPAEHLLSIKRLAIEAGLDVPLYTRTGWPDLATPLPRGALLPLFGGYADGFWDRLLTEMPAGYRNGFLFTTVRADASIATDQLGERAVKEDAEDKYYPYFACEIGGGMERSYHRRIRIAPPDVEASALIKIGSGSNLQGYYMYHGGTNPEGALSRLQESQASGMWNDVPVKSYDFQAPLGEFGQIRPHYHALRRLHLFLHDFGSLLAPMPAYLPGVRPAEAGDLTTLRWAARTDGRSGFVFVSNYQRLQPLPAKNNVQFEVCLPTACVKLPTAPITVPADTAFFWPFGLDLAGITLVYAAAQPICRLEVEGTEYFIFAETPGASAEFVFERGSGQVVEAHGEVRETNEHLQVRGVSTGTDAAIRLEAATGTSVAVVLLSHDQSLACWKGTLAGRQRLFLTHAGLTLDGDALRLSRDASEATSVSIFPAPAALHLGSHCVQGQADGLFQRFEVPVSGAPSVSVSWELVQPAGPARIIHPGSQGVAEAPSDADFDAAAVWRLHLPPDTDPARDLRLRIRYQGDVARLSLNGRLLTDSFYNGTDFEVGLKRFGQDIFHGPLLLQVLPLRRDAPIYLPQDAWSELGSAKSAANLESIVIVEEYHLTLRWPLD